MSLSETQVQETIQWYKNKHYETGKQTTQKDLSQSNEDVRHFHRTSVPTAYLPLKSEEIKTKNHILTKVPFANNERLHQNIDSFLETISQRTDLEVISLSSQDIGSEIPSIADGDLTDSITNQRSQNTVISGSDSKHISGLGSEGFSSSDQYLTLDATGFQLESDKNNRTLKANDNLSETDCDIDKCDTNRNRSYSRDVKEDTNSIKENNLNDSEVSKNDDLTDNINQYEEEQGETVGEESSDDSDKVEDSEDEEKIDVLSLYASDDASFLDDEEEDAFGYCLNFDIRSFAARLY